MQNTNSPAPWILSDDQFQRALDASYTRSHEFLEQANADKSLSEPRQFHGHDHPKLGENGWAPDDKGRWYGPDEYFITNWQVIGDMAVTPSPHPPWAAELFCLPAAVILVRALKAGYEPDPVCGWRLVTG